MQDPDAEGEWLTTVTIDRAASLRTCIDRLRVTIAPHRGADLRQVKCHPSRSKLLVSRSQSGPDRGSNRQSRPSMYSKGGADDG